MPWIEVTAALDKLISIVRIDTNATIAGEAERFRAALTTQKSQHDDYVHTSKEMLKNTTAERDKIATEADAMVIENEDLRAELDVAAQRTNGLAREVELGTVMLHNVEGQLASCESRASEVRLDCVAANQRAGKAEAAREEAVRLRAADGERYLQVPGRGSSASPGFAGRTNAAARGRTQRGMLQSHMAS